MRSMKTREVIQLLASKGFALVRSGEHQVYKCGDIIAIVPHCREVSPGVMRQIFKAIRMVNV